MGQRLLFWMTLLLEDGEEKLWLPVSLTQGMVAD